MIKPNSTEELILFCLRDPAERDKPISRRSIDQKSVVYVALVRHDWPFLQKQVGPDALDRSARKFDLFRLNFLDFARFSRDRWPKSGKPETKPENHSSSNASFLAEVSRALYSVTHTGYENCVCHQHIRSNGRHCNRLGINHTRLGHSNDLDTGLAASQFPVKYCLQWLVTQ